MVDKWGTTIVLIIMWAFSLPIVMNTWWWKGNAIPFISKQNKWALCKFYTTLVCIPPLEGVLSRGVLCCLDPKIWMFALVRTIPHLGGQDASLLGKFFIWYLKVLKMAVSWPMSLAPTNGGSGCRQGKNLLEEKFSHVCVWKRTEKFVFKKA